MLSGACLPGYEQPLISSLVLHTIVYHCKILALQLHVADNCSCMLQTTAEHGRGDYCLITALRIRRARGE